MTTKKKKQNIVLIPYRRDNKWGYSDKNFNIKIPIIYDDVMPFSEGLAGVKLGEFWGFINKKGQRVIEFVYQSVSKFENGKASVIRTDLKQYLIINKKGKVISSGDLKIELPNDDYYTKYIYTGEYGERVIFLMDNNGKVIRTNYPEPESTQDKYWELLSESEFNMNYVYFNNEDKKVISDSTDGYYDSAGNFIKGKHISIVKIKKQLFPWDPEPFTEGFAPVKISSKWNFINKSLQILFNDKRRYSEFLDESLYNDSDEYYIKINLEDLNDFWKDWFKEPRKSPQWDGFDEVRNFSEGLAGVKVNGKWGFVNTKGKVIIKCFYDHSPDSDFYFFKDGIAKVRDNNIKVKLEKTYSADNASAVLTQEISDILFIDNTGRRYFEFLEDVLIRELALTKFEIDCFNEQFPSFSQTLSFLENKKYKELKSSIIKDIERNKTKLKYDQNTVIILGKLKKQTKSLIKLFYQSDIKSESWKKTIFSLVQSLVKKDYEYYDSEYTEYYDSDSKQFFNKLKKDFTSEILVNKMIGCYERNKLKELFRLCNTLNERNEIEIKINGLNYAAMVWNKFSLEILIERIKELLKLLREAGLNNNAVNDKNSFKTSTDYINPANRSESDNAFYQFKSLAELLIKQPKFFNEFISHNYPFNGTELNKWQEYLDWRLVSCNSNIKFDINFINRFNHKWFWVELASNKSIYWNRELLNSFISFLDRPKHILGNPMSSISSAENVEWSMELILEFKLKWDWQKLSTNDKLPWNENLIKSFKSLWDWKSLCINGKFWTEGLISSLENELDENKERWNHLLCNSHIQWSKELIYKHKDKWFSEMPFTGYKDYDVYKNAALPWDEEFIELFKDKLNWYKLSESTILPWSEKLITRFSQFWIWDVLKDNPSISRNEQLMKKFEHELLSKENNLENIFNNPSVKGKESSSDELIDKINWQDYSQNANFKWTSELINKYIDKIDWWNFCRTNQNWSEEIIDKFNKYFHWDLLANNKHFPWNLDLIKRFLAQILDKDKYNIDILYNGTAIPKDLDYFKFLFETFPNYNLEYPLKLVYCGSFEQLEEIPKTNKIFAPILNDFSVYLLMILLMQNNLLPKFLSEGEEEQFERQSQFEMKKQEWEDNYMSKEDLADLLGYDGDVGDISESDIWERTGH